MAIVNPLHLYRSILRTHRLLPQEMRFVGDQYVRAEFRSHRTVTDKRFLDPFFAQWTSYLSLLQEQTKSAAIQQSAGNIGKHLDSDVVDKLGDDKAQQLLELHHASFGTDEPGAESHAPATAATGAGSPKRA